MVSPNYDSFLSTLRFSRDLDLLSFRDLLRSALGSAPLEPSPFIGRISHALRSHGVSPGDPATLFDDYLSCAQDSLPPAAYLAFLDSLGLYLCGRLTHETFIRVVLSLIPPTVPRTDPVWRFLPGFLAVLNVRDIPISIEADPHRLSIYFVVQVRSHLRESAPRLSFTKCLTLLAECLISPRIALAWLPRIGVAPRELQIFAQIKDHSALHPSRLPGELFPFDGGMASTAVQQFALREYRDQSLMDLAPAMLEVLGVPIKHLMSLFKRLLNGHTLSAVELAPIYGSVFGREMAAKGAAATTIIMTRLALCHDRAHARYVSLLRSWMERVKGGGDYRIAYTKWLHTATFCGPYLFPGRRNIDCHSPAAVKCALALIGSFVELYFAVERRQKLVTALRLMAELFRDTEEGLFVVDDPQLKAAVYIGEISRLIGESGDPREVALKANLVVPQFEEVQDTEFGQKLQALPRDLTDGSTLFQGQPLAVVDLPLVKCVRHLAHFEEQGPIVRYPETVEDYSLFSTLHQVREQDSLLLVCNTNISPTYDEEER
jgi:hypothetical protein